MDVSASKPTGPLRRRALTSRKPSTSQDNKTPSTITARPTRLAPVGTVRNRAPPKTNTSKPRSPRDTTPLILDGQEIKREDIIPITFPDEQETQQVDNLQQEEEPVEMDIKPASPERTPPSSPEEQSKTQDDIPVMETLDQGTSDEQQEDMETSIVPEIEDYINSTYHEETSPDEDNVMQEDEEEFPEGTPTTKTTTPIKAPAVLTPIKIATPRQNNVTPVVEEKKPVEAPARRRNIPPQKPKIVRNPTPQKQDPPPQPKKQTPPKAEPKKQDPPPQPKKAAPPKKPKRAPPKKLAPPDFVRMSQTQRITAMTTYRKRFMNLRDAFPGLGVKKIPEDLEPTPENLLNIHTEYDGYMTHILVSEDVSQSMIILVIVLGGIELFLTKVLGLPASNYVIKQFKLINKYRALLYELGEEKIASSGGSSPPLVRLIYLILLTSIATVGIRLFESTIGKTGASMAEDVIYGLLGGGGADAPSGDPTENAGGFDLNGLLKFAGNFLGGNGLGGGNNAAPSRQETRGPTYDE